MKQVVINETRCGVITGTGCGIVCEAGCKIVKRNGRWGNETEYDNHKTMSEIVNETGIVLINTQGVMWLTKQDMRSLTNQNAALMMELGVILSMKGNLAN